MQNDNNYEYPDPDYKYTDKTTGVMKNLLGITDKQELHETEHRIAAKKEIEILQHNPEIINTASVSAIHKRLFDEVYPWAGELRTVNISKESLFFPMHRFASHSFSR